MPQYKIPQEINVEDKIIGPFTLRSFGFVFAGVTIAIVILVALMNIGLTFMPALVVGIIFGSIALIFGFVPFNGKPLYVYVPSFFSFFIKPRQRVWKKTEEHIKQPTVTKTEPKLEDVIPKPQKENLRDVESEIEKISLTVDTGGVYNQSDVRDPNTVFEKQRKNLNQELEKSKATQVAGKEPVISNLSSVNPDKKFRYDFPDTSNYQVDNIIKESDMTTENNKSREQE